MLRAQRAESDWTRSAHRNRSGLNGHEHSEHRRNSSWPRAASPRPPMLRAQRAESDWIPPEHRKRSGLNGHEHSEHRRNSSWPRAASQQCIGRSERLQVDDRRSAGTGTYCWVREDSEHRRASRCSRAASPLHRKEGGGGGGGVTRPRLARLHMPRNAALEVRLAVHRHQQVIPTGGAGQIPCVFQRGTRRNAVLA